MKQSIYHFLLIGGLTASIQAQTSELNRRGLPFLKDSDKKIILEQHDNLFNALSPIASDVGKYAVNVYSSGRRVARGTVTNEGVITKWSELAKSGKQVFVVGHDGIRHDAQVKSVYMEYDLALLEIEKGLPEIDLTDSATTKTGEFIFTVGPAREAHGFGVVSVEPRSLREADKAFLGVAMENNPENGSGVLLESIQKGSAAELAGLRPGDVVKKINDRVVDGIHEMRTFLQNLTPGDKVVIHFTRQQKDFSVDAVLGSRPEMREFFPQRMQKMKRMGGETNDVSEGFPEVLQSDMQLHPTDAGGPVFNLNGEFLGLIVARASRIKTYVITAEDLIEELKKKPDMTASTVEVESITKQRKRGLSEADIREIRELRAFIEKAENRIQEIEDK